jgi:hypothetical protein
LAPVKKKNLKKEEKISNKNLVVIGEDKAVAFQYH